MTIKLGKDSIDLAIVTTNPEAMTTFYRDVLGFEYLGEMATRSSPGGLVASGRGSCGDLASSRWSCAYISAVAPRKQIRSNILKIRVSFIMLSP